MLNKAFWQKSESEVFRVRHIIAILGPVSTAAVQFVISFLLLHRLDAQAFGIFSFALLLIQLTLGVSNALFCAPMARDYDDRSRDLTYKSSVLVYSVAASAVVCLWAATTLDAIAVATIGLYTLLANIRWFGRAHAYVNATPYVAVSSDLIFSITLGLAYAATSIFHTPSVSAVYALFALAAGLSLAPFGLPAFIQDATSMRLAHLRGYGRIWRNYARHALQGVISTEATSNAHAYMITFVSGAASFAPIAAASLSIRPITLCANSITDIERPRMALEIKNGEHERLRSAIRSFRSLLALTWIASVVVVLVVVSTKPQWIFGSYDFSVMVHATAITLVIALTRNIVRPESALLQAAGEFKQLANASLVSGFVSLVAAAGLLMLFGPIASLYGVLLGDLLAATLTVIYARQFRLAFSAAPKASTAN